MAFVFRTDDPDAFIENARNRCGWDLALKQARTFDSTMTRFGTPRLVGLSFTHADGTEFFVGKRIANLNLALIEAGDMDIGVAGLKRRVAKGEISVFSHGEIETLRFLGNHRSRHFSIARKTILDHASALLGTEMELASGVIDIRSLDTGGGVIGEMHRNLEQADRTILDSRLRGVTFRHLEEVILTGIVTYLAAAGLIVERPGGVALPAGLKRAMDVANAMTEPLSVAALAEATGASVRTLQLLFQSTLGVGPHGYLTKIRLERLRQEAEDLPGSRFMERALYWGFTNVTRLKKDYVEAFGPEAWERIVAKRRAKE